MHKPHFVLGLLAQAGHGKSTAAKYLEKTYDAKVVSLANPLKLVAKAVMGFSDAQLWGTQAQKEAIDPRYGMSARTFCKLMGTEGLRTYFWDTIHVDKLQRAIEEAAKLDKVTRLYTVDDVRFLNECLHLNATENTHGGYSAIIRLVCTDAPEIDRSHASENGVNAIPPELISGYVVSSRKQGIKHLTSEIERVIAQESRLAPFRRILRESSQRLARAPRERLAWARR